MKPLYDRAVEDVANLIALEHVNLQIPDQGMATAFYVTGLGLTRDPYMMTGTQFMWVNAGRNQFHLMAGKPQAVSGTIGMVLPNLDALEQRLAAVAPELSGTQFSYQRHADYISATCPWGNRFRCHAPQPAFGRMSLGMPYVEFDVRTGTADGIAQFYRDALLASTCVTNTQAEGTMARIAVGLEQELRFRETSEPIAPFDGHHIQVYVSNFSGPHRRLLELGLVTEESNQHQYRFDTVTDIASGAALTKIEHEVRSLRHPLYARPLVNRNPAQVATNYEGGHDAWLPSSTAAETDDPRMKAMLAERAAAFAAGRKG